MMQPLAPVLAHLETHFETGLEELAQFVGIPSISADPAHAKDVREAAQWLQNKLTGIGLDDVALVETPRHPVVLARHLHDERLPTFIIYGHYDVQPADPLALWDSPPFVLTGRGERLYGRGVSDDKAPLLIPLWVTQAYLEAYGKLPVNLIFLFEGEEEIGSLHLPGVVREHLTGLQAHAVFSADGAMWRADVPTVTTRSRGLVALELTLHGPERDLHSGRHGGAVQNPLTALARLVATLHDDGGRVAVPGFYDDVGALSERERATWAALPFDEEAYREAIGAPRLFGEAGYTTLEQQWGRPTLELNGLYGGYQGPGSKTVLPREAHAKLTCRLVPDQKPGDILAKLTAHLERYLSPGVTLNIAPDTHGARAYEIPHDDPVLQAAEHVLGELYDRPVLRVGMGGSVPICEVFKRELGCETLFFSFAVADENIHAPNEFFRVKRLREGTEAWSRLFTALGSTL